MLEVSALAAARGDRVLFAGLDFSVPAGGLLQVTGRNGTGKTTLLRVLARLARPESGEVRWNGTALPAADASAGSYRYPALARPVPPSAPRP